MRRNVDKSEGNIRIIPSLDRAQLVRAVLYSRSDFVLSAVDDLKVSYIGTFRVVDCDFKCNHHDVIEPIKTNWIAGSQYADCIFTTEDLRKHQRVRFYFDRQIYPLFLDRVLEYCGQKHIKSRILPNL